MAPKEPFKVYSLSKHIESTNKGLSAESQYNRRPANRATVVKKESGSHNPNDIFKNGGDEDDEDSSSDSDSSSDGEGTSNFLQKLGATGVKTATPSRRHDKNMEIADSDAERNASAKAAPAKKVVKPEPESDDSSSESESESEPEAKANTNGAAKASDSTSSSSESESESESDEEAPAKPAQSVKAAPQENSSDSSSESESEDEPETKAAPAVNGKAKAAPAPESDSSEESESESDEEPAKSASKAAEVEAESSSDEDSDDEMVDESMHIEDRQVQRKASAPNFIAPDFVLRKGDDGASGKDVAEICSQANLEGKQFWYFTVPANVPISVVQNMEIPMDNSLQGGALFSHDGDDYGVSFESIAPKSNIQILIPSADSTQYRSASRPVSQVMQVKKITQLASLPTSTIEPSGKRAARPQPKGLKSRYQPLGTAQIEADEDAEEDTEMTEAPVAVTQTKASKKEKKKKSHEAQNEDVATPVSRKGKRKHTTSEEDAVAAAEQLRAENKSATKKSKKQKTDRSGSPDLGSEPPSTKKQTRVPPPTIPQAAPSGTPAAASTVKKSKKSKESKVELPILPSKQTPVPFPSIPSIPSIPFSSQSNATVASPSVIKEEKRSKKREKEAAKKSSSSKVTPIPPPKVGSAE